MFKPVQTSFHLQLHNQFSEIATVVKYHSYKVMSTMSLGNITLTCQRQVTLLQLSHLGLITDDVIGMT